jgi:PncC family amidohydrolase
MTTAELAKGIGEILKRKNWKLAIAESCTGGLLGGAITEIPGASGYFMGGVIAYDNRVKEYLLGVPAEVLSEFGAVSARL